MRYVVFGEAFEFAHYPDAGVVGAEVVGVEGAEGG